MAVAGPVRLVGTDAEIIEVALAARGVLASHQEVWGDLRPRLSDLHRARRRVATGPARAMTGTTAMSSHAEPVRTAGLWTILLVLLVFVTMTTAAMMGPYGPRTRWIPPETAVTIAVPSALVGIVVGMLLLLLGPPLGRVVGALVFLSAAGAVLAAFVGYRVVAGGADRQMSSAGLGIWLATAGALLIVLAALLWRLNALRKRNLAAVGMLPNGDARRAADARQRRRAAHQAAALAPMSAQEQDRMRVSWARAVQRLIDRGVSAEVIVQAQALGPVAWLVWTAYDGEYDTSMFLR